MIQENVLTEELKEIFDNNNKEYVSDKKAIYTDMLKVVYVENNHALGYAVVYEGNDFLEKEKFMVNVQDIPKDSVYIWQIVTKKGYEGRGIATEIITYITNKFENRNIYSCVDVTNIPSLKCHEKCGFSIICSFEDDYYRKRDKLYILLKD